MKHSLRRTIILLIFAALFIVLGLVLVPILSQEAPEQPMNPYIIIPLIIGMIVIGAVVWLKFLKMEKMKIEVVMAASLAFMIANSVVKIAMIVHPEYTIWHGLLIYAVFFYCVYTLYMWIVEWMRKSWYWTIILAPWSNIIMMSGIVTAATVVAVMVTPLTAIILLGLVAIYDAIMVWKIKKMQVLAKGMFKKRVFPGIVVPYENEANKYALLGGGDIFFIVLVAASFYKTSTTMMIATAIGMFAAVIFLFFISRKNKFYPAIPYIFAGMLLGLGVGRMLL